MGTWFPVKPIFLVLLLVLAALAIPSSAAAPPATCSLGPFTPGGDTDCRASYAGCEAHVHTYDVEDALNQYEADCWGCGVHFGTGQVVRTDCYAPPPIASSAPATAALPITTHCWTAEFGSGCQTTVTTPVLTCSYWTQTIDDHSSSAVSCSNNEVGYCQVGLTPVQDPPAIWCEDYGPTPTDSASAAFAPPPQPCINGMAQTWCDFTIGPCDVRVTPWTAWGDQYVVADCHVGGGAGATCHFEVHTQDPLNREHWCAF